jgi:hypothetical protein
LVKEFRVTVEDRPRGGHAIKLPFDPDAEWGARDRHDVRGTISGHNVRGKLVRRADGYYLELGPAWCRDMTIVAGAQVAVSLGPEGPQVSAMADDIAAALEAHPDARRFFESLATFYRKNFIRWIEDAKRPETRARRIADTVAALRAGKREH